MFFGLDLFNSRDIEGQARPQGEWPLTAGHKWTLWVQTEDLVCWLKERVTKSVWIGAVPEVGASD